MSPRKPLALSAAALGVILLSSASDSYGQPDPRDQFKDFGKKGFGPGGPGGFGGTFGGGTRKILKDFDKDGDGRLNAEERQAARESLRRQGGGFAPKGGFGPPGMRGNQNPPKPGPRVRPEDVQRSEEHTSELQS